MAHHKLPSYNSKNIPSYSYEAAVLKNQPVKRSVTAAGQVQAAEDRQMDPYGADMGMVDHGNGSGPQHVLRAVRGCAEGDGHVQQPECRARVRDLRDGSSAGSLSAGLRCTCRHVCALRANTYVLFSTSMDEFD